MNWSREKFCGSNSNSSLFHVPCRIYSASTRLGVGRPENFHEKNAVQLNDTHPAVAVAELMRLLVDEHELGWETAWQVTSQAIAYTNHTLLPEALEKWPVEIFARLLPRHLEIVYEINHRFLEEVRAKFPGDEERLARMSLIDESRPRFVRMANLATVASHRVKGVAQLHSSGQAHPRVQTSAPLCAAHSHALFAPETRSARGLSFAHVRD